MTDRFLTDIIPAPNQSVNIFTHSLTCAFSQGQALGGVPEELQRIKSSEQNREDVKVFYSGP